MFAKPIYEILPYGYLLVGFCSLILIEHGLGQFCGVILIVIGLVVHQLRARYRSRERALRSVATAENVTRVVHSSTRRPKKHS